MTALPFINWETGTITLPHSSKNSDFNPAAPTSQVMIAGDWAPIRHFAPIVANNPVSIYGDVYPLLTASDLSIVNLEAPLSDYGLPIWKSGAVFKGEKCHVKGLTSVPFDVVTLANNHMFDFDREAFQDTLDTLDENNIKHLGAGNTLEDARRPLIMKVNDLVIGLVNFSEGEDLKGAEEQKPGVMGWDLDGVEKTIKELKGKVDFIIAISHCGIEYIPFPPPYVTRAFQRMADAGADMVIGHHPHVPQGICVHNGVPICYSLGNFVFFQDTPLIHRKQGYMVKAILQKNQPPALELIPYEIHTKGISLLNGAVRERFFSELKEISMPLDTQKGIEDAWHGFLHHYGTKGFVKEIEMLMNRMEEEPEKGAAMFRNRLTTLQHFHHWKDALTRMIDGTIDHSPQWARDLTHQWLTRTLDDAKKAVDNIQEKKQ
ncbi:poly-gamma-glutamate synthesis protein (capsule biosynthesis protein) [Desulfocicer vacuolatum DSM 3385]|uniref:Poly-gamma-glutamate synthesis protein (Capsule biosynthesis protein) n=1 Tax=Desulfocicer vacuolatum DSM 3385 TaxID=1121400 RepID=A0A1W2CGF9_9BACT|nr:poly-gamma-glutamate synthesis protein (capsule biosynthesis protein) [Desulfocicer vacuolatum DSM 3385]